MPSSRASDHATGAGNPGAGQPQAEETRFNRDPAPEAEAQAPAEGPAGDERSVAELTEELGRLEDRFKRAAADLDNYRKRVARDVEQRVQQARESLIRDWLEVADSVERALRQQGGGPVAEGLAAVQQQIESVLARAGVERIGTLGERFDPERHEAIEVRDADAAQDRTVLEVARSGYALGGRVLRPAQVVVARRPHATG